MKNIFDREQYTKIYNIDDFLEEYCVESLCFFREFKCERVPSLQNFIQDEYNGMIKSQIIFDKDANLIIGYFTLTSSSMIREYDNTEYKNQKGYKRVSRVIPCVEIEHFALNDIYLNWLQENGYSNKGIGQFIFNRHISSIIITLLEKINFTFVILHAYKHDKVIDSYRRMGFQTLKEDKENIISFLDDVIIMDTDYVDSCEFMFQDTENIYDRYLREE